ncbi:MAG: hypothetical protein H7328_12750 [Bdellovibrio sp.]|nr:hypothetical protein [Bdellovibrio sp.]
MKSRYLLTIAVTLAVMVLFFWKDHAELHDDANDAYNGTQAARLDTEKKSEEVIKKQLVESQALKEKSTVAGSAGEQLEEVQKSFSLHIKQLGQCLGVNPSVEVEKTDPTFDNLVVSLQPTLGDVVVKMDDWAQLDVRAPNGDMRRIRTEIEYQDNNNPVKHTQLYKLNEQGMPELQQLTPTQATDASDESLEMLRGDSSTTNEEKGGRVYYAEGEELVLVERNGKVQSFSLTKGEKTFSCTETDTTTSNCQCL